MVPYRLSYEMANEFKYNSEWTEDYDAYYLRDKIVKQIIEYMEIMKTFAHISKQVSKLNKHFSMERNCIGIADGNDDDIVYTIGTRYGNYMKSIITISRKILEHLH